ncbi:hypothetical protein [Pantanalinema sp. GBBB05]|uniref:hypothetical protein n=1 Tax=Pantanalinema sp. GBBB05 TaxID=2604139 RepID=UPI001D999D54|nr:hypothetical protein [Pantanalinema sp. GBBB05]
MPVEIKRKPTAEPEQQPQAPSQARSSQPEQQQLSDLNNQTSSAIANLARVGVNTINAQVFAFDAHLTQYERDTAVTLANRLKQSQLRIQRYLVDELMDIGGRPTDIAAVVQEVLETPDLNSGFLALPPAYVAPTMPM